MGLESLFGGLIDALTEEKFSIAGFAIQLWHIIVAIAAVVLILVIVIACVVSSKKKAKRKAAQEAQAQQKQQPAPQNSEPQQAVSQPVQPQSEQPQPAQAQTAQTEPQKPASTPKAAAQPVDDDDEEDYDESQERPSTKAYHVSFRKDDKRWQVKLSKGARALKLFNTQEEAIVYAKELAKNQDGFVVIHKLDGKVRKQRY